MPDRWRSPEPDLSEKEAAEEEEYEEKAAAEEHERAD